MSELADFDRPLFRLLGKNETADSESHQSGFLIPKDLREYFPALSAASASSPSAETPISAAIFVGQKFLGIKKVRYHLQTWGFTRSPETRVTNGLAELQAMAHTDDLLIIERSLSDDLFYRFTLHTAGTPAYVRLCSGLGGRRYGVLHPNDPPVPDSAVEQAEAEEEAREAAPFDTFDADAKTIETRTMKIARSRVFQRRVSEAYEGKCAVCGRGMVNRHDKSEVEAAHIVPRGLKGPDDVRNGLGLCKSHHWAFDQGMFGIAADGTIHVPDATSLRVENSEIASFHGGKLRPPVTAAARPDPAAFAWHMEHIVLKERE